MKKHLTRIAYILATVACLGMIGYCVWDMAANTPSWREAVSSVGILLLLIAWFGAVVYDAITGKISDYSNTHKKKALVIVTFLAAVSVFLVCYLIEMRSKLEGYSLFDTVLKGADIFSYYTAQLSITFISISVLSVLSDKSVIIYWANVSEDRLIKPTFSCFAAYTYYSIGAAVGAGIAVAMGNGFIFAVFFALNILVMVSLTLSMIDVYYGRDEKKKKLRYELEKDYIHVANVKYNLKKNRIPEAVDLKYIPQYTEKMLGLRQHMYNAYAANDLPELREIYTFYAGDPQLFNVEEGEPTVSTLVDTFSEKTFSLFVDCVLHRNCYEIFQRQSGAYLGVLYGEEITYGYLWDCDLYLWKNLSESRFIQSKLFETGGMRDELQTQLLDHARQRVSALYNYLVLLAKEDNKDFNSDDYFIRQPGKMYIIKREETGVTCSVDKKMVEEVFEMNREFISENAEILKYISKTLDRINFMGLDINELEEEFPFLTVLEKYAR